MVISLSVIIPCYNGWKYMEKCLDALENQSRKVDEIIIVDDNSNDGTYEKLCEYADSSLLKIQVIRNSTNVGPGKARQIAIELASSDYIAFCDCDDWYEKDFSRKVMENIERSHCDVLLFDNYVVKEDGSNKVANAVKNLQGKSKKAVIAEYARQSRKWLCL